MRGVEFNLLPQSRMHIIEAKAKRDQLFGKAIYASLVCLGIFLVLATYADFVQKAQLSSLNKDLADKSTKFQKVDNINTIITIENQLKTASQLNQNKHVSSRIFNYLGKLTPLNASVGNVQMDLTSNIVSINGNADSANTVNAFIDALKAAQYKTGDSVANKAFSNVVENSFSISSKNVTYALTANFDAALFANNAIDGNGKAITPSLSVPSTLTGRASADPSSLFNQSGGH